MQSQSSWQTETKHDNKTKDRKKNTLFFFLFSCSFLFGGKLCTPFGPFSAAFPALFLFGTRATLSLLTGIMASRPPGARLCGPTSRFEDYLLIPAPRPLSRRTFTARVCSHSNVFAYLNAVTPCRSWVRVNVAADEVERLLDRYFPLPSGQAEVSPEANPLISKRPKTTSMGIPANRQSSSMYRQAHSRQQQQASSKQQQSKAIKSSKQNNKIWTQANSYTAQHKHVQSSTCCTQTFAAGHGDPCFFKEPPFEREITMTSVQVRVGGETSTHRKINCAVAKVSQQHRLTLT